MPAKEVKNLRRRALRGVFWTLFRAAGSQGSALIVFAVLARLLAPEDFGLIALATIYMSLVQMFIDQGLGTAVQQRAELEPEHLDSAFWLTLGMALCFAGATALGAPFIAKLLGEPRLTPVIRALSIVIVIVGLRDIQVSILRRRLQFRLIALRAVTASIVGGIVGVSMAFAGKGAWSLVGQQIAQAGVGTIILWRVAGWRPRLRFSFRHLKDLWGVSMHSVASHLLVYARRRSNDFIIGTLMGPVALGHLVVAQRLNHAVVRVVTLTVSQVAFPTFARVQSDPERLRRLFLKATRVVSLLSFPTFVGLAALAPTIVPLFFGVKWMASVPVMQIMAIGSLYQSIGRFNGTVIGAIGRTDLSFRFTLAGMTLSILSTVSFAPYGLTAVAMGNLVVSWMVAPFIAYFSQKLIGHSFKTYFRQLVPSGGASLLMFMVVVGLGAVLRGRTTPYVELSIQVLAGVATYVGVLFVFARPAVDEFRDLVRGALRRGKKGEDASEEPEDGTLPSSPPSSSPAKMLEDDDL